MATESSFPGENQRTLDCTTSWHHLVSCDPEGGQGASWCVEGIAIQYGAYIVKKIGLGGNWEDKAMCGSGLSFVVLLSLNSL